MLKLHVKLKLFGTKHILRLRVKDIQLITFFHAMLYLLAPEKFKFTLELLKVEVWVGRYQKGSHLFFTVFGELVDLTDGVRCNVNKPKNISELFRFSLLNHKLNSLDYTKHYLTRFPMR